ncbi:MAG: RHS repeat-associated core domain-containing protein [Lachnospiraceae bacterium]|nr:RHS repeat-associated core domain-containing protein [Lachnospiraceae bacterium]
MCLERSERNDKIYDENGSLISEKEGEKTTSYQYDLLNRQAKVRTSDGRKQENLYDGEGLRAGLKEKGKESTFLFYNGEILAECDGDNMPVRRHLSGLGLSHVQTLNDGIYHTCHQDEQGSIAYITGNGGAVENRYDYDAFGNVLESRTEVENHILYRGQQYDQEAGQYYLRARYYNPVIGRFTQEDTYRGDGLNLYAYCGINPVMYYDSSGHDKITQPTTELESPKSGGEGNNYAFLNKIDSLLDGRSELVGSTRDKLLATVQGPELNRIVNELYRPGASIGDGGTAAILVEEFNNGSSTHLIKATERLKQLENLANTGRLGLNDLDVIEALIDDLEYAIGLFNWRT